MALRSKHASFELSPLEAVIWPTHPVDEVFLRNVLDQISTDRRGPWSSYLAWAASRIVGACCFKTPPSDGEVEIAYATLPSRGGEGFGKAMVKRLLWLAEQHASELTVVAHTLPVHGPSTGILRHHGFQFEAEVIDPQDGLVWRWTRPVASRSRLEAP